MRIKRSTSTNLVNTEYKYNVNIDSDFKAVERVDNTVSQATRLFFHSTVNKEAGKKQVKTLVNYLKEQVKHSDDCALDKNTYTSDETWLYFVYKAAISAISADNPLEKPNGEIICSKGSKKPTIE